MRTVALVAQKGGVGKSTLAAGLAVAAMQAGHKVAALDLDPQRSLATWGSDREADEPAVEAVPAERAGDLPAMLAVLDRKGFGVVILDCPGTASTAVNSAMRAASLCLVPTRPTAVDLRATRPTVSALVALKREFAFVLSQVPTAARSSRATEAAAGLEMMGVLASPPIGQRTDHQDAFAAGLGVTEYAPASKAADEIRDLWRWIERKT